MKEMIWSFEIENALRALKNGRTDQAERILRELKYRREEASAKAKEEHDKEVERKRGLVREVLLDNPGGLTLKEIAEIINSSFLEEDEKPWNAYKVSYAIGFGCNNGDVKSMPTFIRMVSPEGYYRTIEVKKYYM